MIGLVFLVFVFAGATVIAARKWRAPASDAVYNGLVGQILTGGTGQLLARAMWPTLAMGWLAIIMVLVPRQIEIWLLVPMCAGAALTLTTILLRWPAAIIPPALRKS